VPSRPAFLGNCPGCNKNGDLLARIGNALWAACSHCKLKWDLGGLQLEKTANAFPHRIATYRVVASPPLEQT
jgi:ribosomal protein L37AE/L43A